MEGIKVKRKGKRKGKKKKKLKRGESSTSKTSKEREKYARVLDYLPHGRPDDSRPIYQKKPLVQAIGEDKFVLMELSPKKDKIPSLHDRIYIGECEREVIDHVIKRLKYRELTTAAKEELPYIVKKIVNDNEKRFIKIFNEPKGILKKYTRDGELDVLLGERRKEPFLDFEDIKKRIEGLCFPEKIIIKIIEDKIREDKQNGLEDIINGRTLKVIRSIIENRKKI